MILMLGGMEHTENFVLLLERQAREKGHVCFNSSQITPHVFVLGTCEPLVIYIRKCLGVAGHMEGLCYYLTNSASSEATSFEVQLKGSLLCHFSRSKKKL